MALFQGLEAKKAYPGRCPGLWLGHPVGAPELGGFWPHDAMVLGRAMKVGRFPPPSPSVWFPQAGDRFVEFPVVG